MHCRALQHHQQPCSVGSAASCCWTGVCARVRARASTPSHTPAPAHRWIQRAHDMNRDFWHALSCLCGVLWCVPRPRSSACVCGGVRSRTQGHVCRFSLGAHVRPTKKKNTQALRLDTQRWTSGVYALTTNPTASGVRLTPPGEVCTRACTPPRAHAHAVRDAPDPRATHCILQGGW